MKVAVIVSSCDFFKDCWEPFILGIQKYWKDCPWPIYIVSNHQKIDAPDGISFITVGDDKKFSSNLKQAIGKLDSDFVIYLQEDYWLNAKVDVKAIEKHLQYCEDNGVDYLRLGVPFLNGKKVNEKYVEYSLTEKYTLCLQAAIWRTSVLNSLLLEGDSGWDFEYRIQQYAIDHEIKIKALGLTPDYLNEGVSYVEGTAVRKGRWTRPGYLYLKENSFDALIGCRNTEGWVLGTFQEVHGLLRPFCLGIVKVMKTFNWNF